MEEAVRGGGAAALYADATHRALSHPRMLEELFRILQLRDAAFFAAKVCSVDGYYASQGAVPNARIDAAAILNGYRTAGVDALDMASETVLVVGQKLGLVAGALLAVHANRGNDTWLEKFEPTQDAMISVATPDPVRSGQARLGSLAKQVLHAAARSGLEKLKNVHG